MKARILCIAGAHPNFITLAPLVAALERDPDFSPVIVHAGQHYDDQMSGQFVRDLAMSAPKFNRRAAFPRWKRGFALPGGPASVFFQ
jgi:UDP-N-acetylglucosamine 2-epimerase